eukprot:6662968-Pyramimonas_sp.AAC.1
MQDDIRWLALFCLEIPIDDDVWSHFVRAEPKGFRTALSSAITKAKRYFHDVAHHEVWKHTLRTIALHTPLASSAPP